MRYHFPFLWLLAFAASGCASFDATPPGEDLEAAYALAVRDASRVNAAMAVRDLIAIAPREPGLSWQGEPGKSRILVMTWTDWPGYGANVGHDMDLGHETWVTTVPELRTFCRALGLPADKLTLRLEQLLGLPPGSRYKFFVEMWVNPDDLFRPAPNPEITSHESSLDFPRSPRFLAVAPDHVSWFEQKRLTAYGARGYPWTRLGYTYDWGRADTKRGLSEFVVKEPARIGVASVSEIEPYCLQTGLSPH